RVATAPPQLKRHAAVRDRGGERTRAPRSVRTRPLRRRSAKLDARLRGQRLLARSREPAAVAKRHVADGIERRDAGQAHASSRSEEQRLLAAHACADRVYTRRVDRKPWECPACRRG